MDGIDSNCNKCDEDATTYVRMTDGVRRYYCADCIAPIFRHGPDQEDIEDGPRIFICSSCGKLTLNEVAAVNVCPECRHGNEGHAEEIVSQIAEASDEVATQSDPLGSEESITVVEEDTED